MRGKINFKNYFKNGRKKEKIIKKRDYFNKRKGKTNGKSDIEKKG